MTRQNTDIEKSKITLSYTKAASIVGSLLLAGWLVSSFISSFKSNESLQINNVQQQLNSFINRFEQDSAVRDTRLKDFKHYYGKDTLQNIH